MQCMMVCRLADACAACSEAEESYGTTLAKLEMMQQQAGSTAEMAADVAQKDARINELIQLGHDFQAREQDLKAALQDAEGEAQAQQHEACELRCGPEGAHTVRDTVELTDENQLPHVWHLVLPLDTASNRPFHLASTV